MTEKILEIARAVVIDVLELEPDEVGDTDDFYDDLGGDSLQKLSIIDAFERRTGVEFDPTEGRVINSVEAMVVAANRHQPA